MSDFIPSRQLCFSPGELVMLCPAYAHLGAWVWQYPTETFQVKWEPGNVAMFVKEVENGNYTRYIILLEDRLCEVIRSVRDDSTIFEKYVETK